uniref:HDC07309 n=1 Tax=Drosophila melanogaster TaxID=7227 RepID=Q6IG41_DROME|nr:TPA_inf: HDC07309 [Drosophila melanogaster]
MAGERKRGGEHGQVRKPQGKDTQAAVMIWLRILCGISAVEPLSTYMMGEAIDVATVCCRSFYRRSC